MRVLLTNDDGVDSEGLFALKEALSPDHEITIIAPDRNWSTSGHTRTMDRPLRVSEVRLRDGTTAYATDGTPSDCVALAALGFLSEKPELVVSGINRGNNMGDDITYSGTVAAAMEGIVSGMPSIAVSMGWEPEWLVDVGAAFVKRLVQQISVRGLDKDILLNVNVPSIPHDEIKGVEITRLGKRVYNDELIVRTDPRGRKYYWMGGTEVTNELAEGTDVSAIEEGRVSITPIHMDLTNHNLLDKLRSWDLRF
ncbi:MAG TPA: 5'/3'-nucleotidase SurE [Chloroflexia bacterium]|nr:5'/3'-nucleotidase SurE [Chloroflexia bacterium]